MTPEDILKSQIEHNLKGVVGRENLSKIMFYAICLEEHVLLVGPPGTAKTMLCNSVLGAITDSQYFNIACSSKMSEDYLVGPLDMKEFRETGAYVHKTEGSLVTADYAFIDEFLDLQDGASRSLLEILNERTFTRCGQSIRCPLKTAVAATNFNPDSEELEAVKDRFLFRDTLEYLDSQDHLVEMLNARPSEVEPIDASLLPAIKKRVQRVVFPTCIQHAFCNLAMNCRKEGMSISDRRIKKTSEVAKLCALVSGRMVVLPGDILFSAYTCFGCGRKQDNIDIATAVQNSAVNHLNPKTVALLRIGYDLVRLKSNAKILTRKTKEKLKDFLRVVDSHLLKVAQSPLPSDIQSSEDLSNLCHLLETRSVRCGV